MKVLFFLILIFLTSCAQALNEPEKLISENEMSSLIADFALAGQMSFVSPDANAETQTRYILKQHKIKAKDFRESYTYYTGTNKLDKIFTNAQDIIFQKDPKAKDFIKNRLKGNQPVPQMGK